jgi:hypothetical protein
MLIDHDSFTDSAQNDIFEEKEAKFRVIPKDFLMPNSGLLVPGLR